MSLSRHLDVRLSRRGVSRRSFLHQVSGAALAAGTLSFRDLISLQADDLRREGRSMILLWMAGGPCHLDTFDPNPGTEAAGTTQAIHTSVSGIQIAQDWPKMAAIMDYVAILRSMTNKEGQHQRATYQLHTGYVPSGSVKHPSLGSSLAQQLADPASELPSVVSVGNTVGAGFLGVDFEPFNVSNPGQLPQNVASPVPADRVNRRLGLLNELEGEFASRGGEVVVRNHRSLYQKASKLVLSPEVEAFNIGDEPAELRARYGENDFGKGCLLARRLIEKGVTFVEVRSNGWDTHEDHFERNAGLAAQVDPAMSTLITDLKDRGMLDRTLVVWMGEFGRTPRINPRGGRDHFPVVFNALMAGGGVRGGRTIGSSNNNGTSVEDRPVAVPDLFCSICESLKVNPRFEHMSPLGRPMKIVDGGEVVSELFA